MLKAQQKAPVPNGTRACTHVLPPNFPAHLHQQAQQPLQAGH